MKTLIALAILLTAQITMAQGDSCANAIPMSYAPVSLLTNQFLSGDSRWYTFTAQTSEIDIQLTNLNPATGHIHDIMLMEGFCSISNRLSDNCSRLILIPGILYLIAVALL
jgi:hypothetical protein